MSILDRLHTIISADIAKLFSDAKRVSVQATNDVEKLEADLVQARQRAIAAAEAVKQHAEAAAEQARKAADDLAIEAKAAAERVAFHTGQLERKDPS